MRQIVDTEAEARAVAPSRRRRGLRGQRRRRRREHQAREAAVAYLRWHRRRGRRIEAAAGHLQLCPRTLRRWELGWREDRLDLRPRGRPIDTAEAEQRAAVYGTLHELGPGIGVPTLRTLHPDVGKRELEELVRRWRQAHRRGRRLLIHALQWKHPGSVWAMDFAEPPAEIDGLYDQILCVRDLPSHYQLWSLPTIGKDARTVIQSLEALVKWSDAPLVLKVDNDGVFRSHELKRWCKRHGTRLLYSPPRQPSYNGSVECGIGSLKVQTHYISALHDRPGRWTCDDVERARQHMNLFGRPRGAYGPSPSQLWREHQSITDEERTRFDTEYRCRYENECTQRGTSSGVQLQHDERSSVDRAALARTMTTLGYLLIRRRRITLPVRKWKTDRIPR